MVTKKQLLKIWQEYGFRPSRRYGQNFLIDNNIKEKIIRFVNPKVQEVILEVGPGFGQLTEDLAALAHYVIAVERDHRIVKIVKNKIFKDTANVDIVECDFLKYKIGKKVKKVVGNLPYYITTPIIEKLLALGNAHDLEMFLMVQREYADRMLANPGDDDYSALSCFVQFHADIKQLMRVKRSCFFPEPKVDSVFLRIKPFAVPKVKVRSKEFLSKVIRFSFQQRRKTIVNSLCRGVGRFDRDILEGILKQLHMDRKTRPENLSLIDFAKIADALFEGNSKNK